MSREYEKDALAVGGLQSHSNTTCSKQLIGKLSWCAIPAAEANQGMNTNMKPETGTASYKESYIYLSYPVKVL